MPLSSSIHSWVLVAMVVLLGVGRVSASAALRLRSVQFVARLLGLGRRLCSSSASGSAAASRPPAPQRPQAPARLRLGLRRLGSPEPPRRSGRLGLGPPRRRSLGLRGAAAGLAAGASPVDETLVGDLPELDRQPRDQRVQGPHEAGERRRDDADELRVEHVARGQARDRADLVGARARRRPSGRP